jgi:anti-sigma28 factor (negative regulator of flagellin synthesis)
MKIDERVSNYMDLLKNEPARSAAPAAQATVASAAAEVPPDAVDLSAAAVLLAEDQSRRERLNIIRQQLAEGSYNISGKDVADKILNVLKG